jgi:hypothetical protein
VGIPPLDVELVDDVVDDPPVPPVPTWLEPVPSVVALPP